MNKNAVSIMWITFFCENVSHLNRLLISELPQQKVCVCFNENLQDVVFQ